MGEIRIARPPGKPVLLYDRECRFCCRWAARWKGLTSGAVSFEPLQDSGERFPELARADLEAVVHLVEPSGTVRLGADAVFHTMAHRRGWGWLAACYRRSRLFARVAEWGYRLAARFRKFLP